MQKTIPASVSRLLWDADPDALDPDTHRREIIERVLNYGTLGDWRWAVSRYGVGAVRAVLSIHDGARDNLRAEARRLAALILR